MKVLFIINGKSKKLKSIKADVDIAKRKFTDLIIDQKVTQHAGDCFRIANTEMYNFDAFIACGGDGTFNEMINGLYFTKNPPNKIIGLVAAGSANDFVKTIGKKTVDEILTNITANILRRIDIGLLSRNGKTRVFANAASNGIGGLVFRRVDMQRGIFPPRLNYTIAILWAVLAFKRPKIEINVDGKIITEKLTMVVVGKGNYIGFGLGFTPQSSIDDEKFGLTILRNSSYYQLISKYLKLTNNQKIDHPWLDYLEGKKIKLSVINGRVPIETDGEYYDVLSEGDSVEYTVRSGLYQLV